MPLLLCPIPAVRHACSHCCALLQLSLQLPLRPPVTSQDSVALARSPLQGNIEAEQEAARKKAEKEAEEAAERERQQVGCCLRCVFWGGWCCACRAAGDPCLQSCWLHAHEQMDVQSPPAGLSSVFCWLGTDHWMLSRAAG